MRLVLDIDEPADGRMAGFVQPAGAQGAMPFSGLLELLATIEELLLVGEGPGGLDEASGGEAAAPATGALARSPEPLKAPSGG